MQAVAIPPTPCQSAVMTPSDSPHSLLPARSQPLIATLVVLGLVTCIGVYVASGGFRGGLVDPDTPPPITKTFTVNINAATTAEFSQLPGLGAITAQKIVEYRRDHGPFTSHEDLLAVPGVGPVTLDALRPHLRPIRKRREAP